MTKSLLYKIGIAVLSLTLLGGCASQGQDKKDKKLVVYASFYPMYDFAKKIGGNEVKVVNMTPAGTEPHDYEPTSDDLKGLSKADVFVYNSDAMEHWAKTVIKSVDNKNLTVVKAAANVQQLKGNASQMDPHTWLSIRNAIKEMDTIKEAFIKKDPAHKEVYQKNYAAYAKQMKALDQEYTKALAKDKGKSIVVAHQAFGYLCRDYDLKQIPIEGLVPDSEPDSLKMKQIIDQVKDRKIKVIFYEELVSPKVAKVIADETGTQVRVLNTLEGLSNKEIKEGKDYISVMKENLKQLEYALGNEQ